MLKDKFLLGYKGTKYVLYVNGYTMEFASKECAESYKKDYKLSGYIVKEG